MLFLGVDGGQSSTKAIIADETGLILGRGLAGPCNHVASREEGRQKLAGTVRECVESALQALGCSFGEAVFESACFGMSGGPEDKLEILQQVLRSEHLTVTHDGAIALMGATAGRPGIIVIGGTGSFAFGRNGEGRDARAGGWGYIFGDEGGAFDIVRQATRAMLREHEGHGVKTDLTRLLLPAVGVDDANQMLHAFYTSTWPRSRVASLASHVDAAAQRGDAVALEILKTAGRQLAQLAISIQERIFQTADLVPVAAIGGAFRSQLVSASFRDASGLNSKLQAIRPAYAPDVGALLEAFSVAGRTVTLHESTERTC
jgi:N-acetylglucosamine kinase-like BadF-type ATPase